MLFLIPACIIYLLQLDFQAVLDSLVMDDDNFLQVISIIASSAVEEGIMEQSLDQIVNFDCSPPEGAEIKDRCQDEADLFSDPLFGPFHLQHGRPVDAKGVEVESDDVRFKHTLSLGIQKDRSGRSTGRGDQSQILAANRTRQ